MTTSVADMIADVDKFTVNLDRLNQIVNGGTTTVVTIDSGTVPSIANFFANVGSTSFATTAQGAKADTALQPSAIGVTIASAAQGTKADLAINYIASAVKLSQFISSPGANDATAINAFLTALKSSSRCYDGVINIPVNCGSALSLTSYTGKLSTESEGSITFNNTNGITIDNSGITAGRATLEIDGLRLYTTTDGVGTALSFLGSQFLADSGSKSIVAYDLLIQGITTSVGWANGFNGNKVVNGKFICPQIMGRSSFTTSGYMGSGFIFSNGTNQVDIISPTIDWTTYGINVLNSGTFSEGVRTTKGDIRATQYGFVANGTGSGFASEGTHYDTTRAGVQWGSDSINGCNFGRVAGGVFLRSSAESYAGTYIAVATNSVSNVIQGIHVWINNDTTAHQLNTYGIVVGSLTDTTKIGLATITGNLIEGCVIPIHLRTNTLMCNAKGNSIDAYGNASMTSTGILNDGGANNSVTGNMVRNSSGTITIT